MRADEKPVSHYAKANEVIAYTSKCGEEIKCVDIDYINQLRYERLMAKAKCFWYKSAKMQMADQAGYAIPDYNRRIDRIENIALAYGARARRIKEDYK